MYLVTYIITTRVNESILINLLTQIKTLFLKCILDIIEQIVKGWL